MIIYTTGDLLKSSAEALVNTVNCEGYMGKGIAYQFKLQYPENNIHYVKACKNGTLTVGRVHAHKEKGKLIINFPTKNKWRAKSKMEYIEAGLDSLISLIKENKISSIAIPPLGSGNGGLIWREVRQVIESKLATLQDEVQIVIYEPSQNYAAQPVVEPKLSMSALVLMEIKKELDKFDALRLQKTAYFINIFSGQQYFKFKRHKYGPYDNSIAIVSKTIKEFQKFHSVKNTDEAYRILYNKIVSEKVEAALSELQPSVLKATAYVNSIPTNQELECLATILFLIEERQVLSEDEIVERFKAWSQDKAIRFSTEYILAGIYRLNDSNMIERNLMGYRLANDSFLL